MYNLREELSKLEKLEVRVSVKLRPNDDKGFDVKIAALTGPDLEPAEDGLILQSPNDIPRAFSLVVTLPLSSDLAVVIVDGRKSQVVSPQKPVQSENGTGTFVRNFATSAVYGGHSTKPNNNSLRLVSVRDNLLQIFSFGVVTRLFRRQEKGAHDFLVVQEMYRARLFRRDDEIVAEGRGILTDEAEYAGFNRWPAMKAAVSQMIPDKSVLPVFVSSVPVSSTETLNLDEGEGRVIFFDIRRGFGFADTAVGAHYFNWQEDDSGNRLPFFGAGQAIKFAEIRSTVYGEQLVDVRAV